MCYRRVVSSTVAMMSYASYHNVMGLIVISKVLTECCFYQLQMILVLSNYFFMLTILNILTQVLIKNHILFL